MDNMLDLVVSSDFKWETTQDIDVTVSIGEGIFLPIKSKVSIYGGDPATGSPVISSGSLSQSQAYSVRMRVPSYLRDLYITLESSTGTTMTTKAAIVGGKVNHVFSGMKEGDMDFVPFKSVADPGPECDNCDVLVSGSGNVTIKEGKTYCITDTFNGSITYETWNGGGTLKVCGTATLSGTTTLGTNSHIVVTQNGSLTINSLSIWGSNPSITVYANASLRVNSGFSTSGHFLNHGTVTVDGGLVIQQLGSEMINNGTITLLKNSLQLNSVTMTNHGTITVPAYIHLNTNSSLTNNGDITAGNKMEINGSNFFNNVSLVVTSGYFNMNSGSKIINQGSIEVQNGDIAFNSNIIVENRGSMTTGKDIDLNSASNVKNYCKMIAADKVEINSGQFTMINGYLSAGQRVTLNGSGSMSLQDASMVSTDLLTMNASIYGVGAMNTVLATTKIHINSNNVFSGNVEAASNQLFISQNTPRSQHLLNGATYVTPDNMQNFIPITACNPEGVGSEGIVDTDNDGVPDDLDAFPADPERAFRSWYPNETTFATLAFEDLWPGLGDFDFNDVVIEFQYEMITNAQNELKDLNGLFRLMAAGASLNNGFAIAMPFASNKVESVTGGQVVGEAVNVAANGTESGHSNETVILVLDAIGSIYGEFINTQPDKAYVETDTLEVKMILSDPVVNYGTAPFNPFIFVDQERGKEVHMIDHQPTELVNNAFFGTWEDRSDINAGKFYQTSGRLPWAIEIPVSFDYPIETVDILLTHLKFAEWAMSSGTQYQDWYMDKSGYRNTGNIYVKPDQE